MEMYPEGAEEGEAEAQDSGPKEELWHVGQGLTSLCRLAGSFAPGLVRLNLACNALSTLRGVEGLTSLRRLSLQRNQLTSLEDLRGLRSLRSLDASANSIRTLAGAASGPGALTALTELALHRNLVADAREFGSLGQLPHLVKLSLYANPAARRLGPERSRAATLATLAAHGRLRFLDAVCVGPGELAEAARSGSPSWADIAAAEAAQPSQQRHSARSASERAQTGDGQGSGALGFGGPRPAAQLSAAAATSPSAAVALLPQLTVAPTKPSTLNAAAAAAAALRREPPVICFSSRHANGMPAATLRQNQTGSFSWPSGGLAASADLDTGGGYRLLAMFDGAGAAVALSADAGGGFAQYVNGRPALAWKRGGGGGTHTSPDGAVLATWTRRRRLEGPISVDLGQGLSVLYSASDGSCSLRLEAARFDPAVNCMDFSQNAGARVVLAGQGGGGADTGGGTSGGTGSVHAPPAAAAPALSRADARAVPDPLAAAPACPVDPPVQGHAAAAAAAAASGDLAAVIARAQALMARTAAEQQAEADAQAAQQQAGMSFGTEN
ncbi:hypothetical protein Rsub_02995 [Raphidocelis subcapitata]|uniref:Uncharacterized protein n=1 Tax=Raphidocelis subcapitata TaxID=307507 RepID=A0A2V0P0T0_9CHLO|nr:hypothetical protein Rsub_02995 [Raphidocelis subcapitata]|eukprot:GBF90695.1 hypothetical protein Rsub_02995 [Raphidocelis subcapitata]